MLYAVVPCVRVEISHHLNRRGVLHDDGGFIDDFMAFCANRGYAIMRTFVVSRGLFHGDLASNGLGIEDMAVDIETWLKENGGELDMRTHG